MVDLNIIKDIKEMRMQKKMDTLSNLFNRAGKTPDEITNIIESKTAEQERKNQEEIEKKKQEEEEKFMSLKDHPWKMIGSGIAGIAKSIGKGLGKIPGSFIQKLKTKNIIKGNNKKIEKLLKELQEREPSKNLSFSRGLSQPKIKTQEEIQKKLEEYTTLVSEADIAMEEYKNFGGLNKNLEKAKKLSDKMWNKYQGLTALGYIIEQETWKKPPIQEQYQEKKEEVEQNTPVTEKPEATSGGTPSDQGEAPATENASNQASSPEKKEVTEPPSIEGEGEIFESAREIVGRIQEKGADPWILENAYKLIEQKPQELTSLKKFAEEKLDEISVEYDDFLREAKIPTADYFLEIADFCRIAESGGYGEIAPEEAQKLQKMKGQLIKTLSAKVMKETELPGYWYQSDEQWKDEKGNLKYKEINKDIMKNYIEKINGYEDYYKDFVDSLNDTEKANLASLAKTFSLNEGEIEKIEKKTSKDEEYSQKLDELLADKSNITLNKDLLDIIRHNQQHQSIKITKDGETILSKPSTIGKIQGIVKINPFVDVENLQQIANNRNSVETKVKEIMGEFKRRDIQSLESLLGKNYNKQEQLNTIKKALDKDINLQKLINGIQNQKNFKGIKGESSGLILDICRSYIRGTYEEKPVLNNIIKTLNSTTVLGQVRMNGLDYLLKKVADAHTGRLENHANVEEYAGKKLRGIEQLGADPNTGIQYVAIEGESGKELAIPLRGKALLGENKEVEVIGPGKGSDSVMISFTDKNNTKRTSQIELNKIRYIDVGEAYYLNPQNQQTTTEAENSLDYSNMEPGDAQTKEDVQKILEQNQKYQGYRIAENGETVQAGDYNTRLLQNVDLTITNAPKS